MKFSIITATRNNVATLSATIESVLLQKNVEIEYIIVDGASNDGSLDVIKKYAHKYPQIIRFISEPDNGVYSAINKGIKMATGDIVGLLHGNDTYSSSEILSQINEAMQSGDVPFVFGDVKYTKVGSDRVVRYYSSARFEVSDLLQGIAPPHPSLYMRRELFKKYGLYKEDYLIGADFDMFLRLMVVNKLQGKYLALDMVTMTTGGLSTRLYHQIFTNNREKCRALRENSCNVSLFLLLKRYLCTLKSFINTNPLRNSQQK